MSNPRKARRRARVVRAWRSVQASHAMEAILGPTQASRHLLVPGGTSVMMGKELRLAALPAGSAIAEPTSGGLPGKAYRSAARVLAERSTTCTQTRARTQGSARFRASSTGACGAARRRVWEQARQKPPAAPYTKAFSYCPHTAQQPPEQAQHCASPPHMPCHKAPLSPLALARTPRTSRSSSSWHATSASGSSSSPGETYCGGAGEKGLG